MPSHAYTSWTTWPAAYEPHAGNMTRGVCYLQDGLQVWSIGCAARLGVIRSGPLLFVGRGTRTNCVLFVVAKAIRSESSHRACHMTSASPEHSPIIRFKRSVDSPFTWSD